MKKAGCSSDAVYIGRYRSTGFEDGGRGHEPRNAGGLQRLEKSRKQFLFESLQKKQALPRP